MTRFARARGSKASNEKAPDDGTPWEVMKEQMLQAKKESEDARNRKEAENQRIINYEKFLKDQKVQKRKATWCDFPEEKKKLEKEESNTLQLVEQTLKKKKKNKLKNGSHSTLIETMTSVINEPTPTNSDEILPTSKKSKKNKKQNGQTNANSKPQPTETNLSQISKQQLIKKKKNKKISIDSDSAVTQVEDITQSETTISTGNLHEDNDVPHKENKAKKSKKKKNKTVNSETSSIDPGIGESNDNNINVTNKQNKVQKTKKKNKKLVDGKPIRRKEINDHSFQLIINGKDVELVRFDGFPIMKKDADRLAELKSNMIKKGIPKSEVQRTMKLERRRAEKALARLKRDVCYNCRKGGHNLSDCPELKSKIPGVDAAEGVCFKCGSTEHRQFECKVQRDNEFRFATCFICKEPGHIARQCPDNPKGLYPNGGGCKLCGDVTHLRKDCPTVNTKKEVSSVKLQTLDSNENIEDIQQEVRLSTGEEPSKKPKKIKF